jgi:predicted Ser/Thr protein kinase
MFAVLTRMRKPSPERYSKPLKEIISGLTALEKMDLYGTGTAPSRLDDESAKLLRASISEIYHESDIYEIYEGSVGASPREMRTALLDAAQNPLYDCLSPFAVLEEIGDLCEKTNEYIWLQEKPLEGGYHDHARFRKQLRERLLDLLEDEFRVASGLVDDVRYQELFDRYVMQVSYWVKGERIRNPMTGNYEDPDERLMQEVEALLMSPDEPEQLRHSLINRVAAWAIDHPGEPVDNAVVFPDQIRRLREAAFADRRGAVGRLCRDVAILLREEGSGLGRARSDEAQKVVDRLCQRYGYVPSSVADAAAALVRERFSDVVT